MPAETGGSQRLIMFQIQPLGIPPGENCYNVDPERAMSAESWHIMELNINVLRKARHVQSC